VLIVTGLIGRAGDAAIAGYGIGSRPGIHAGSHKLRHRATLTTMVGTNIGARQHAAPSGWPGSAP